MQKDRTRQVQIPEADAMGSRAFFPAGAGTLRSSAGSEPQPDGRPCRVLVVDDSALVRQGVAGLLGVQSDMEVVGQAETGRDAVALADALEPDVVTMDVNLPDVDGIEVTRRILAASPGIRVIGFSMHTGRKIVEAMREAGAVAYLQKLEGPRNLIETVRYWGVQVLSSEASPGQRAV